MRRPPGEEPLMRVRTMRRVGTEPEQRLWRILRNRQVGGVKFRRQVWLGPHIADFMSNEAKLVVEVDGDTHMDAAVDATRRATLAALGFRVVRVGNRDVMENIEGVVSVIEQALTLPSGCAGRAHPSPRKGEGI